MSSPATLPLNSIVNVQVFVSPQAPPSPTFNQGLIVGTSTVIPSQTDRIRSYASVQAMAQDGFATNSPEYIAAQIYFSQPNPPTLVWIGRQDLTSILTAVPTGGNPGTGYVVGDVLTVAQGGGASGGKVAVTTVGGSGQVTGVAIVADGTGYTVANGITTTGGTGTGAQINVTAIGETPLIALQACRTASSSWWGCMCTAAVTADHEAIAAYVESMTPVGDYFYTTQDTNVPTNGANNVFAALKALLYSRTTGIYSTTQSGAFPNNIYAAAAVMGVAMGLNTGLAGSAFTLFGKKLVGISTEPLSSTAVGNIQGNNGNVYLDYGNVFPLLGRGQNASGVFLDQILNRDMLVSNLQFGVMELLTSVPKVPQTNAGQTQILDVVNQAAQTAADIGFIAGGTWTGVKILNLNPGDPINSGYLAQSPPYNTQSKADRIARKAMPVYLAIIEAGAAQSLLIGVYDQT